MKKRYIILLFLVIFIVIIIALMKSTQSLAPEGSLVPTGTPVTLTPQPASPATHDKVEVTSPAPGSKITSPLAISGKARLWYFEGSFPIELTDDKGNIIAQKYVTAQGDWMTSEYVPFLGTLEFTVPAGVTHGYLILRKDNPSDDRRLDDEFSIPVTF